MRTSDRRRAERAGATDHGRARVRRGGARPPVSSTFATVFTTDRTEPALQPSVIGIQSISSYVDVSVLITRICADTTLTTTSTTGQRTQSRNTREDSSVKIIYEFLFPEISLQPTDRALTRHGSRSPVPYVCLSLRRLTFTTPFIRAYYAPVSSTYRVYCGCATEPASLRSWEQ